MRSTEHPRRQTPALPPLRDSRTERAVATLVGVVGLAVLVSGGCDTTAKVSFPSRSFDEVHSTGLNAPAGACGQMGGQNSTATLRFVLEDDNNSSIRPQSKGGRALDSGHVELTPDSIAPIEGQEAIFEAPDLQCGKEWPGAGPGETGYTAAVRGYDGECSGSFDCGTAVSEGNSSMQRCNNTSNGYGVASVSHAADVEKGQVFGVLMENAGSLRGVTPLSGSLYYDANGDGEAEQDVGDIDHPATDGDGRRYVALGSLSSAWENARETAELDNRDTEFGLWSFSGDPHPTSLVDEELGEGAWTGADDPDKVEDVLDGLELARPGGRANVLESLYSLLDPDDTDGSPFAGEAYQGLDKTLVVFVDGPPDNPPGWSNGASVDEITDAAQEANVRIFFVHLDPRISGSSGDDFSAEEVVDDHQYYSQMAQSDNCESASDCAPHETCREVRGFSGTSNGDVGGEEGEYRDGKFCMPERRADSRTGPLQIYSEIACATGGGYQYVKEATDDGELSAAMGWLPYTMDGLWEAEVAVQALERRVSGEGDSVRLQGSFEVTAGQTTETLELSQTAGSGGEVDTRSTLFTGGGDSSDNGDEGN